MKIILQRVTRASVTVNNNIVGRIGTGYLVLLGIGGDDDRAKVEKAVDKIQRLRIFEDNEGKINLPITSVQGALLVVSQFTLYADCRKGNRPSFTEAAPPPLAEELYRYFIEYANGKFEKVEQGVFGAKMQVESVNSGPFTVILDEL
ncbi:MAG: D-aminoacyl-tRNA deacylase [Oscillospiraceae bacterium]|nr:D-aminoacyl-tRNA deacylase [Oscillospiraceae bacterium]